MATLTMTSHDGTGAKEGLEKQEPASENAFSAAQPETGDVILNSMLLSPKMPR